MRGHFLLIGLTVILTIFAVLVIVGPRPHRRPRGDGRKLLAPLMPPPIDTDPGAYHPIDAPENGRKKAELDGHRDAEFDGPADD